ncbi:MAG: YdcF family protein [Bacteroidota bacterium]
MFFAKIKSPLSFLLITLLLSSCALFRPSPDKLYSRAIKNVPYDVIIVPGVPYDGKEWSPVMRSRVVWGCYLVKKGIAKNVIFSGGAVYTPYIEAKVMALYAEKIGIQKDKIFIETQAEHSTENIFNSYCLARKKGFTKIAIATDQFQSALLMGFTKRKFLLPITHIPILADTLSQINNVNFQINADSAKVKNFKSILETQSKWFRFRGTQGKNIKFEKE